jgi:hypothetical protein
MMAAKMNALFTYKTPFKDMHSYPAGEQLQYCFSPEIFKYGLLDLHAIERTFTKDNKQYWREVVKANIMKVRRLRNYIKPMAHMFNDGQVLSHEQSNYYAELDEKIDTHKRAIKIARQRSFTGYGLQNTTNTYAQRLETFYMALVKWERVTENNVFRGNVLEDALGIVQKKVYFTEASEGYCGIHNGLLLKYILADINTNDEYSWLFTLAVFTEMLSERLATLVKGTDYKSPIFKVSKDFYDH